MKTDYEIASADYALKKSKQLQSRWSDESLLTLRTLIYIARLLEKIESNTRLKPGKAIRMAKRISLALFLALCLVSGLKSEAQTFYNLTLTTNTISAPVLKNFQIQSFQAQLSLQPQTFILTNLNTNDTYYISYGAQLAGAAGTNLVNMGTITTNFNASLGFTNGGTAIVPIAQQNYTALVNPWGTFSNSAWSNGGRTNGIGFQ